VVQQDYTPAVPIYISADRIAEEAAGESEERQPLINYAKNLRNAYNYRKRKGRKKRKRETEEKRVFSNARDEQVESKGERTSGVEVWRGTGGIVMMEGRRFNNVTMNERASESLPSSLQSPRREREEKRERESPGIAD